MRKEKKPLFVARETVRNLDSPDFLKLAYGANKPHVPFTSTVPWTSENCCGCA
jgi:hypothetical protein